jgi:NADH-quinone oxidoreductase subunit E
MDDGANRQGGRIEDSFDLAELDLASARLRNRSGSSKQSAEPVDHLENSLRRLHRYAEQAGMGEETVTRGEQLIRGCDPQPRGALVPLLLLFEEAEDGRLSFDELIEPVAEIIGLSPAGVRGVVTFHPALRTRSTQHDEAAPVGRCFRVCGGLSCALMGARRVTEYLAERFGIAEGSSSAAVEFRLESCQCLGACSAGPVMTIDGEHHESFTLERIDTILQALDMVATPFPGGQVE